MRGGFSGMGQCSEDDGGVYGKRMGDRGLEIAMFSFFHPFFWALLARIFIGVEWEAFGGKKS